MNLKTKLGLGLTGLALIVAGCDSASQPTKLTAEISEHARQYCESENSYAAVTVKLGGSQHYITAEGVRLYYIVIMSVSDNEQVNESVRVVSTEQEKGILTAVTYQFEVQEKGQYPIKLQILAPRRDNATNPDDFDSLSVSRTFDLSPIDCVGAIR